jgi:hypothetical protein
MVQGDFDIIKGDQRRTYKSRSVSIAQTKQKATNPKTHH